MGGNLGGWRWRDPATRGWAAAWIRDALIRYTIQGAAGADARPERSWRTAQTRIYIRYYTPRRCTVVCGGALGVDDTVRWGLGCSDAAAARAHLAIPPCRHVTCHVGQLRCRRLGVGVGSGEGRRSRATAGDDDGDVRMRACDASPRAASEGHRGIVPNRV